MSTEQRSWHFGIMSFTGTGHLMPFILLAQLLKDRGHRVTFFEKPKIEARVRQAGLDFFPIGRGRRIFKEDNEKPFHPNLSSQLSTLRFNLRRIEHDLAIYLQETPAALRQAHVDVLLVNEIALTGPTVAQIAGVPYFMISISVPHSFGWGDLPWFTGYKYSASWFSLVENALLEVSAVRVRGPIGRALDKLRREAGLGPVRQLRKSFPELAHIAQLPKCLDFQRSGLPSNFYYTGPFTNQNAPPRIEFPWDRLDGRPIVYASLGTTRNVLGFVFRLIAEACRGLDIQLVISLGGRFDAEMFADLPGNPLVVKYAPQLELLRLAKLVITHAGPNTVFEALMEGKPMVAIPLAHDQPAVAARLARLGVAVVLPVMRLTASKIHKAVTRVMNDESYRVAAARIQAELRSLNGLQRAADVIEETLEEYLAARRGPVAAHDRTAESMPKVSLTLR